MTHLPEVHLSMTYHVRVLDMPSNDRPRERLLSYGSKSLSTAELLAILLGTGQGNDFHAVCQDTPCVSTLPELSREPIEEIFVKY